jgi:hypothetical protein
MTIVHPNERTRYRIASGSALYLNPRYEGNGLYLNRQGGILGLSNLFNFAKNTALPFLSQNSGLIRDGVEAGSKVASAISDIKRAADEAGKLKEIRKIRETLQKNNDAEVQKKQTALTEQQKQLIENAIASASALKNGGGLKRF